MIRELIEPDQLALPVFHSFGTQWMLLTSGINEPGKFNTMTIAWGSIGVMWRKPFAQVVVRPSRYTFEFMEQYPTFSLCVFPEEFKPALQLCGSSSGRDGDKIAAAGLTPIPGSKVEAPGFAEAELIIECRKMYWQDIIPAQFLDPEIEPCYGGTDYHRCYFGEVLAVHGVPRYKGSGA